eukprot:1194710-Prorocentrum_minimum.AAC.5
MATLLTLTPRNEKRPRRWLSLYEEGVFALQTKKSNEHRLAFIQKLIPEDLLLECPYSARKFALESPFKPAEPR